MITQAIKRWLNKLFGWLSWGKTPETEYAPVGSPMNKIATQESMSRPSIDDAAPQFGVAPRIAGQAEISCSTIDEWPERVLQPLPPPVPNEKIELPPTSTQLSTPPPGDAAKTAIETSRGQGDAAFPAASPPTPTPEQHLDFLRYLVIHGRVNEGFAEGQVPEQYRK